MQHKAARNIAIEALRLIAVATPMAGSCVLFKPCQHGAATLYNRCRPNDAFDSFRAALARHA